LGFVIPSGIYTDLGTKPLREMLLNEGQIEYLYSFSNERFFFPAVDHRFKFTLLGAQKGEQNEGFWATFRFNPRVAVKPEEMPEFLANPINLIYIRRESVERFSPDSLSVMEFQTQRDYDVSERIYDEQILLGEKVKEGWNVKLNNEFHFTNDRHLLNQQGQGLPLYEGKMIHQFDAYFAKPQFWIASDKIAGLPIEKQQQLQTYRVVHRRIASTTNERTLIAAIVSPNSACEVNATVILINGSDEERTKVYVCALLNSFILDYIIRYKVTTTLNMFYVYQLPVPRLTAGNPYFEAMVARAAVLTCTRPEFAGLWAEVMGKDEGGRRKDENISLHPSAVERQTLRDELDALAAHLYGLSRADFEHILGTFPLVFPPTEAGRAKKTALLAEYDRLAAEVKGWPRR
jgi:hypothetical protein